MCFHPIQLWFVCKLCRSSFEKLDKFLEHKRQKHFTELQKTKCIVFEETLHDYDQNFAFQQSQAPVNLGPNPAHHPHPHPHPHNPTGFDFQGSYSTPENLNGDISRKHHPTETITSNTHNKMELKNPFSGINDILPLTMQPKAELMYEGQNQANSVETNNANANLSSQAQVKSQYNSFLRFNQTLVVPKEGETPYFSYTSNSNPSNRGRKHSNVDSGQSRSHSSTSEKSPLPLLTDKQCRSFPCGICGKSLKTQCSLKNHIATHSDLKPFKCPIDNCSAAFKTNCNLIQHKKISHSDSKPFECPQPGCFKAFKTKFNMTTHFATHNRSSNQLLYKCSEPHCEQEFVSSASLKCHVEFQHTGTGEGGTRGGSKEIKRFECNICKKTFSFRHVLQNHLLVHSDDKPFICTFEGCTSAFKRKQELIQHERFHMAKQYKGTAAPSSASSNGPCISDSTITNNMFWFSGTNGPVSKNISDSNSASSST